MVEERPGKGPHWWHLLPIGVLLVASSLLVGFDGYVFIDEAAVLGQVDLVTDGSWTATRPLAALDPDGTYTPMARSVVHGDQFAPYPSHPLHVLVGAAARQMLGGAGLRLLSVLGVLGAAAAAGTLARVAGHRVAVVAMWLTAIASPLVFDANLVAAHAVASGIAGLLVVLVFHSEHRRGRALRSVPVLGLAVAAVAATGALLRSEAVLFAAAVGLVAVVHGSIRRRWSLVVAGISAIVAGAAAYALEPIWTEWLVGSSDGPKVIDAHSRGGAGGRLESAGAVLLGFGNSGPAPLFVVVFAVAALVILRFRPSATTPAAVLAGGTLLAGVAQVMQPAIIPGIVWAFPGLAVSAVAFWLWPVRIPPALTLSLQAVALFALAVLATQHAVGGGVEWGWRYAAIALPVVCALAAVPVVRLVERVGVPVDAVVLAGIMVACLLVPMSGLLAQRRVVGRVDQLLERTELAFRAADAELIVAAESSFGRYAWQRSIAGDLVTVPNEREAVVDVLQVLDDRGHDRVLLVFTGTQPPVEGSRFAPTAGAVTLLPGAYSAVPLSTDQNIRSPS